MKRIDEQQMDLLIASALERQHVVESINKAVMRDIRRTEHHRMAHQWLRVVAFSFGLPLVLVLFGFFFCRYVITAAGEDVTLVCTVFPVAAMLYGTWKAIKEFSVRRSVINGNVAGLIDEV